MKDAITNLDLQEEFHAVMEDIKPKNIKELVEVVHSSETLLTSKNHPVVEMVEEIQTTSTDPPTSIPIYEEPRIQYSMELPKSGLPLLCRLCATRSNNMILMFNPTEQHRNITQKIQYCLPIVVDQNDNLSKIACQLCLAKLELTYQFYQTVVEAEKFLTIREGTWKALKEEPMTDTTTEDDAISENFNNLGECRTSSLSDEYQNGGSFSNSAKCRTKETLITDTIVKKIVILSNADSVIEDRTNSSDDKCRKTGLFSNNLDSSTKNAPIIDTTVKHNVILSNANVDEDRERNPNDKYRKIDQSSNSSNCRTKESPIPNATVQNNIISSNVGNVGKDRMKSSSNKRRKTGSSSIALNCSTKKAPIPDANVQKNTISLNLNNIIKNRMRSSSDKVRRRGRFSNSLNCSNDEAPLTDATGKSKTLSSISLYNLNNIDKHRTNSSSNKHQKTDTSSNALNLSKTKFQLKQITSSCVPIQTMHPVHSKQELKSSKEMSDSDEYCPPITRSHNASKNRNTEDVSKQYEKSLCNVSEKQLRPQAEINPLKGKRENSNDIKLQPRKKIRGEPKQNYQCTVCGMTCFGRLRLIDHMVNHTNERPFECQICEKRFNRIRSRNRHILTHTAEKPYECDVCGLRVRWKHSLKKHRALHEKYEWPIDLK